MQNDSTLDPASVDPRSDKDAHRAFLNTYYGITRHIYDVTRRYFLFGRDDTLRELLTQPWSRLVEVGVGTGRNLRHLARRRPSAEYGGLDASDEMLAHVGERFPEAHLRHGFAEDEDLSTLLPGGRPERILFSYCLSMVGDPAAAIENARRALAPGGKVVVVDFGDMRSAPAKLGPLMHERGLRPFHVTPLPVELLEAAGGELTFGPWRYWVRAEIPALP